MKRRTAKDAREKGVKIYARLAGGISLPWTSKREKLFKLCAQCTELEWSKGIDVEVKYQKDVGNGGTFNNIEDLKEAITVWLSPDLV